MINGIRHRKTVVTEVRQARSIGFQITLTISLVRATITITSAALNNLSQAEVSQSILRVLEYDLYILLWQ